MCTFSNKSPLCSSSVIYPLPSTLTISPFFKCLGRDTSIVSLNNFNLYFPPRTASAGVIVISFFRFIPSNLNSSSGKSLTCIIKSPFLPPFLPGFPSAASLILSPFWIPIGTFTENVLSPVLYDLIASFFSAPKNLLQELPQC